MWRVTDGGWQVTDGGWGVIESGWWVTYGSWRVTIRTYGLHQTWKKIAGETAVVKMSKTGDVRTFALHQTKDRKFLVEPRWL